jgi:hypothetical protein
VKELAVGKRRSEEAKKENDMIPVGNTAEKRGTMVDRV